MSYPIEKLRSLSEEQLASEYDRHAVNTMVGIDYYHDELERRSRERATAANLGLARQSQVLATRSYWLTVASTGLSAVAVVIAVIALLVGK